MLTDLIFDFFGTLVEDDPGRFHRAMQIAPCFSQVVASAEVGIRKPSPEIFHHTLRLLGIPPDHALYVGDTYEDDYLGARSAGIRVPGLEGRDAEREPVHEFFGSPPGSDQKPHPPPPPTEAHPPPTRPAKGDHTRSTSAFLPHSGQAGAVVRSFRCTKTSKVRSHRSHRNS